MHKSKDDFEADTGNGGVPVVMTTKPSLSLLLPRSLRLREGRLRTTRDNRLPHRSFFQMMHHNLVLSSLDLSNKEHQSGTAMCSCAYFL